MLAKFRDQEKTTILTLDNVLKPKSIRRQIDAIAKRVEQKLIEERPDPDDERRLNQRLYVGKKRIE